MQVCNGFGVAMRFSTQTSEIAPEFVVHAFNGVGMGFASLMLLRWEDFTIGMPKVGGVSE